MVTDKEFIDEIHFEIHSLRRIPNYKPSIAEINISRLVMEHFKDSCRECRARLEQINNTPKPKSFLSKLGGVLDGN